LKLYIKENSSDRERERNNHTNGHIQKKKQSKTLHMQINKQNKKKEGFELKHNINNLQKSITNSISIANHTINTNEMSNTPAQKAIKKINKKIQ
jgi:hypothetical protein